MTSVLYDAPGPAARRRELIGSIIGGILLLGLLGLGAWQLQQNGIFEAERWSVFYDPPKNQRAADVWNFVIVEGLGATLRAAVIAAPLALAIGLLLAVGRITPQRWISWPTIGVIELFRGLPVVLMMLFGVLALKLPFLQAVVFGLVVDNKATIYHQTQDDAGPAPDWRREARSLNDGLIATKIPHRFYRRSTPGYIYETPKLSWIVLPTIPARARSR
jgi:glutamate transport system permease protein